MAEKDPDKALKELQEALVQAKKGNSPDIARMYVRLEPCWRLRKILGQRKCPTGRLLEIEPGFLPPRVALTKPYVAAGNEAKAEEELTIATKAEAYDADAPEGRPDVEKETG